MMASGGWTRYPKCGPYRKSQGYGRGAVNRMTTNSLSNLKAAPGRGKRAAVLRTVVRKAQFRALQS
jgi:hypothetical protein